MREVHYLALRADLRADIKDLEPRVKPATTSTQHQGNNIRVLMQQGVQQNAD